MAGDRIYCPSTRRLGIVPGRTLTRHGWSGERDFRDFSGLPPAQENREQSADPAPAVGPYSETDNSEDGILRNDRSNHLPEDIFYGNGYSEEL